MQTIEMSTGAANATLRVNSPADTLDFALSYSGGGITLMATRHRNACATPQTSTFPGLSRSPAHE